MKLAKKEGTPGTCRRKPGPFRAFRVSPVWFQSPRHSGFHGFRAVVEFFLFLGVGTVGRAVGPFDMGLAFWSRASAQSGARFGRFLRTLGGFRI